MAADCSQLSEKIGQLKILIAPNKVLYGAIPFDCAITSAIMPKHVSWMLTEGVSFSKQQEGGERGDRNGLPLVVIELKNVPIS